MTTDASASKTLAWALRTVAGTAVALLLIWFVNDSGYNTIATQFWVVVSTFLIGFALAWKQVRAGIVSLIVYLLLEIALASVRFWPSFLGVFAYPLEKVH